MLAINRMEKANAQRGPSPAVIQCSPAVQGSHPPIPFITDYSNIQYLMAAFT